MKRPTPRPPVIARLLLRCFLRRESYEIISGDLDEEWTSRAGRREAGLRRWYWTQSIGSIAAVQQRQKAPRKGGNMLRTLGTDLRQAARSLRSTPTIAIVATFTLAAGLGLTSAAYTIAVGVVWPVVPGVAHPETLVEMRVLVRRDAGYSPRWLTPTHHATFAQSVTGLVDFAGYTLNPLHIGGTDQAPERVEGVGVMPNYFDVLGLTPLAGRLFVAEDDQPGAEPVVVISAGLWKRMYQSAPTAIGSTISLNGNPVTIIGVTPEGFFGTRLHSDRIDIWYLGAATARFRHFNAEAQQEYDRGRYYMFVGRRTADVGAEQLTAQLTALLQRLGTEGATPETRLADAAIEVHEGLGPPVDIRPSVAASVRTLFLAAVLVLVIAVTNVANLMMFRGLRRQREMVLRRALGASAARIIRQHFAESLFLALMGSAVGLLLTVWLVRAAEGVSLGYIVTLRDLSIDWRTLLLTALTAIATATLFGTAPAFTALRANVAAGMNDRSAVFRTKPLARTILITSQLAASMTLAVGAILFTRSISALTAVDLLFEPDQVVTHSVNPSDQGYDDERAMAYYQNLLQGTSEMPGVQQATISAMVPLEMFFVAEATRAPNTTEVRIHVNGITRHYFATMGIPLRGRPFSTEEVWQGGGPTPVIITDQLATSLFDDGDAIGKTIMVPGWGEDRDTAFLIIGIAADARARSPRFAATPVVYFPLGSFSPSTRQAQLSVKTVLPLGQVTNTLRERARTIDPSLPLHDPQTMTGILEERLSEDFFFARTSSFLAVIGFILATIGVYGLVAFGVSERTREFGIRQAIGALPSQVFTLVLRHTAVVIIFSVALGTAVSIGLSRFIASQLFGTVHLGVDVILWGAGLVTLTALLASLVPARSATKVDPLRVLRLD